MSRSVTDALQIALDFTEAADALAAESQAVREREQRDALVVCAGRRHATDTRASHARYNFAIDSGRGRPALGEHVVCRPPACAPIPGTVLAVDEAALTLQLAANVGSTIDEALIQRDPAWLLDAQRERLTLLRDALGQCVDTSPWSHTRVAEVLRPASDAAAIPAGEVRTSDRSAADPDPAILADLNEEQADAVRRVLGQPTTIIWGPAGTGKTRTLCAALSALAARGETAVVLTPSNASADVLVTQLLPLLAEHPLVGRGVVQRHGANVTDRLSDADRALVMPAAIQARLEAENDLVRAFYEDEHAASGGDAEAMCVLEAEFTSLAAERAALPAEIARNASVIVTPICNIYLRPELWQGYDAVVLDEASMLSVAQVALAVGLARRRVVIAGDWQQLGPVTVGRSPAVRRWLGTDVFRAMGVPERVVRGDEDERVVMLTEQYRMPAVIADLLGELYYLGRLRTARGAVRRSPLPFGGEAGLLLVDTASLEPTVRQGSRANPVHAAVVTAILRALETDALNAGSLDAGDVSGDRAPTVGVYTLYRDQVACLRAAHRAAGLGSVAGLATTVHRGQGAEADVVLLDLADSPPVAPAALRAETWDSDGARLALVGLSRTRAAAVVIVNVPYLRRRGGAVIRHLLDRIADVGTVIDARELVDGLKPCPSSASTAAALRSMRAA